MIAIFITDGFVNGWLRNVESEETLEGTDYVLVDEFPEIITDNPGKIFTINRDTKVVSIYEAPPEPKTEIQLLREENVNLKSRMTDLEMFAADLITGGGI